jgi:hypothetical protein
MNTLHYHFPEGYVSDELFDILHETYREFETSGEPKFIVVGGSFSLNAQSAIHRRVSALDICVSRWHYSDVRYFMMSKVGTWFEQEDPSNDMSFSSFKLINGKGSVCLYRHENFDKLEIKEMDLHGRTIYLFPAAETIGYKLKFLEESPGWTPQHEITKHFRDSLSYVRMPSANKWIVGNFTNMVLHLRSYDRLAPELQSLLTKDEFSIIEKHHSKVSMNKIDTQLYK